MKNATLQDIAIKLGLSTSTVSRALNDHPDINAETKNLVRNAAKELNYQPNILAKGLKGDKMATIGVIVPEIKHDFFSSAISGIEQVAYQSGFIILVCQSNESSEREVINTKTLLYNRVAGIIASISQDTNSTGHFQHVIERNIPLVFFDRVPDEIKAHKVVIDDMKSSYDAVNFLIQKGYNKIAHFAGPPLLGICKNRLVGYKNALLDSGKEVNNNLIVYGGLHEQDGYNAMDLLIKNNLLPDSIFAVNDPVAIGAFQRIKEANLKIPEDIGIVGFSNNKIASIVEPPLTTINQPSFEMGKRAAKIIIDMIENGLTEPITEIMETELVVRNSA